MVDTHEHEVQLLAKDFLHDYFDFYPRTASILGLHEYDGRITDLSPYAIQAWVNKLKIYQERLGHINPDNLERLSRFDYDLLHWRIHADFWYWSVRQEYMRNPMIYADNAMVDDYIKRNYAPLVTRAESLVQHLREIPAAMDIARYNLTAQYVPRILIEESQPVFDGVVDFLRDELDEAFGNGKVPESLMQELHTAQDAAIASINNLTMYLNDQVYADAQDNFSIGKEQFTDMLRYDELVDMPLEQLLALGEADLQKNEQKLADIAHLIDPNKTVQEHMQAFGRNHPTPDELLDATRSLIAGLRDFLIEHDIVTLPQTVDCIVEETPPFARWAFAMMDTAGPFEKVSTESFYYITLPEADWPPEKVEGWLTKFDYATMTGVSIHEAYPGHYVHFANINNAPTMLAKVFETYSHYESWAHYSEEMMLDEGYGNGNLQLRMAQLSEALVRNCRYVCAIQMHTHGMSVEDATRFFMEHAYMDKVTAEKEARRGTHDPGYINYTLGKLLLLKLREDYKAAYGNDFSLKRFHDEYIGYGSPPIPILRKMMLPAGHNGSLL